VSSPCHSRTHPHASPPPHCLIPWPATTVPTQADSQATSKWVALPQWKALALALALALASPVTYTHPPPLPHSPDCPPPLPPPLPSVHRLTAKPPPPSGWHSLSGRRWHWPVTQWLSPLWTVLLTQQSWQPAEPRYVAFDVVLQQMWGECVCVCGGGGGFSRVLSTAACGCPTRGLCC
jgi:hypothetical protein